MKLLRRLFLALAVMSIAGAPRWSAAQEQSAKPARNPLEGNPRAIQDGKSTFRVNCAYCHGANAGGGFRAPSLATGHFAHGDSGKALLRNILRGIPGTQMPANDLSEAEGWEVIAYLRSLQPAAKSTVAGNAAEGEKYFFGSGYCSTCHMVRGKGGRFGPDLSRIGAMRSADCLTESLREPNKRIAERSLPTDFGTSAVTDEKIRVTAKDGKEISGIAMNEDGFSLQLLGFDGKIHLWRKDDLKKVVHEGVSPMPAYGADMLDEKQLQDLLAYLQSLRGE